jgi:hypothetical protein
VPSPSVPSSPLTAPASRENPGIGESPEFEARLARERQTTAALALGVTGVVLGAAGALVLAWNQGRSADYERAQRSLGPPPPPGVRSQEELDRAIAFARATEKNEVLRRSIRDFDVVGWSGGGLGVALLSVGGALYLTRPDQPRVTVGLGGAKLSLVF